MKHLLTAAATCAALTAGIAPLQAEEVTLSRFFGACENAGTDYAKVLSQNFLGSEFSRALVGFMQPNLRIV